MTQYTTNNHIILAILYCICNNVIYRIYYGDPELHLEDEVVAAKKRRKDSPTK
jgi:hypothetical protein